MKNFLRKTLAFAILSLLSVVIVILGTKFVVLDNFNFKQKNNIHILILGDSHTQCGINDRVFPNSINLSESADTYFYSYVKLKRMLAANSQIDTLILGYAPHNITNNNDYWLQSAHINSYKIAVYFALFDRQDFKDFIRINPNQIFLFSATILKRNFSYLYRICRKADIKAFGIGGFKPLEETMKESDTNEVNKNISTDWKQSKIDIVYLNKIYQLCKAHHVKIILLSTPLPEKHPEEDAHLMYIKYWKEHLTEADYLNFEDIKLAENCFADGSHLNKTGADIFSLYLKDYLHQ